MCAKTKHTPLTAAAKNNYADIVFALGKNKPYKRRADVDMKDGMGYAAIHIAAQWQNLDCVLALIFLVSTGCKGKGLYLLI